jgi:hypothetical protein
MSLPRQAAAASPRSARAEDHPCPRGRACPVATSRRTYRGTQTYRGTATARLCCRTPQVSRTPSRLDYACLRGPAAAAAPARTVPALPQSPRPGFFSPSFASRARSTPPPIVGSPRRPDGILVRFPRRRAAAAGAVTGAVAAHAPVHTRVPRRRRGATRGMKFRTGAGWLQVQTGKGGSHRGE